MNVWLNVNAPYIYPINLFHISWNTKCQLKIYISRKTLVVVNLVSRRVNLSVHHQCFIQKSLRINAQPQLQSSASHHTLVSPMQAPYHLPGTHLQTSNLSLSSNIFLQSREDACPLVPIFNPSRLRFNHSNNISRYFDHKLKPLWWTTSDKH